MYMYTPIQMEEGTPISNHLGEFDKIILDLKNINCNLQSRGWGSGPNFVMFIHSFF